MEQKRFSCQITKKVKARAVVEGFPGFGLVGTIATGFLVDHLQCEQIGKYWFETGQPTIAIHGCKLVDPIGIFYNKKYNIVLVHSIQPPQGMEWLAAEIVLEVAKQVGAEEIITLEGVGSQDPESSRGFFYTNEPAIKKKFEKLGIDCLGEGIIVGVTSALLLKAQPKDASITALFSETHSQLPDSKAAAKIIELLDQYLGLKVSYQPLLKQAEMFESKLRGMLEQAQKSKEIVAKKDINYVG